MLTATQQPRTDDDIAEIERSAFNAAFHELGMRWHWDRETFRSLSAHPCERVRIRSYVEVQHPHLLRAYDAEFLADAILGAKRRAQQLLQKCASSAIPRFNWADPRWGEVGF